MQRAAKQWRPQDAGAITIDLADRILALVFPPAFATLALAQRQLVLCKRRRNGGITNDGGDN